MNETTADERVIVSAQVDVATRDELERLAREGHRSLSGQIRMALASHLAERDQQEEATYAAPRP